MENYLTIEELAVMLKLSKQTIRRYVLNRTIPFHKIGKAVRFRPTEIEKWIDGGNTNKVITSDNEVITDETDGELIPENSDCQNIDCENKEIL